MRETYTRRRFLRRLTAGGAAYVMPFPSAAIGATRRPSPGALRLVFYTDVHARTEWDTPLALEKAADAINAQRPDFVFAGGDLITEGLESSAATVAPRWDAYMAMHRAIKPDIFPAIGNHDLVAAIPADGTPPSADPRAIYRDKLGVERTYYAFDTAGYHFIVLDSIEVTGDEFKYQGLLWPEELEWLRADLAGVSRHKPIVLVTHIPLLTVFFAATKGSTFAAGRNQVVVNNAGVLRLFSDHHLHLVLQGHLHVHEMMRWRRTTFITGGAVCGKWWRGSWQGTEEGFCVVTLRDHRIAWDYVDYGWEARHRSKP